MQISRDNLNGKPNILWIFVDGVRRYHTDGDDRGRLDIMDEFGKESVEFLNVVTSAPSTFQSLSAMASGMHSCYLARNFDDFIFDSDAFPSITHTLQKANYHCYSFLMHKDSRVILANMFPVVEHRYWPKGFSHQRNWDNNDINTIVANTLSIGTDKPSFFFVDFNCRQDPDTSDKIKSCIEMFRRNGYTQDNTITILCSDHGYPDPSKRMGPEFYKQHGLSHDLVLTDDNIMIPLLIQYPGCTKGKKIETTVGSIDLFPTILDLIQESIPPVVHGKSLGPLIDGNPGYEKMMASRFHRSDSRLLFQTGRGTAIRNDSFKYIYYHDDSRGKREEFFDIINDPLEKDDLTDRQDDNIQKNLEIFREAFQVSETDAMDFQLKYLFQRFSQKHEKELKTASEILITDSCNPRFLNILIKVIKEINDSIKIYVLLVEHDLNDITEQIEPLYSGATDWSKVTADAIDKVIKSKDIDILFAPYNISESRDNKSFTDIIKRIKAKKKVYLDYNMGSFKETISYYWKMFLVSWPFIRREPSFLWTCCVRFLKYKFSNRKGDWIQVFKNKPGD